MKPFLPALIHYGDALAVFWRNPDEVEENLRKIAAAGYHGVRTWTVLATRRGDFWVNRDVGPWVPGYADIVARFQDALKRNKLQWLVSQGDLWHLEPNEREEVRQVLLNVLQRDWVFGIDGANEAENNGNVNPNDLRNWLAPFVQRWPDLVWSLSSPVNEDKEDLDAFDGSVYDVHGYRGGHWWDKVRHVFSLAYELKPAKRLGIQSEPVGPGPFISVTEHKDELQDGNVMAAHAAMAALARQAYVYFAGFEKNNGPVEQSGFLEIPRTLAALPQDLMSYQALVHGGQSQSRRIFEVTEGSHTLRCDHAIHDDGRFVCLVYGPDLNNHRQLRGIVTTTIPLGDKAILYIGHL